MLGANDLAVPDLALVRCCCCRSRSPPATIGFLTYGSKQTRPPGHAPCLFIEYALNIGSHHLEPLLVWEKNIAGRQLSLFTRKFTGESRVVSPPQVRYRIHTPIRILTPQIRTFPPTNNYLFTNNDCLHFARRVVVSSCHITGSTRLGILHHSIYLEGENYPSRDASRKPTPHSKRS